MAESKKEFAEDEISLQEKCNSQKDYKRFYNRIVNPFLRSRELKIANIIKEELLKLDCSQPSVIEVGCGEGANLYWLREAGVESPLTGVDFSEDKIKFAKKNVCSAEFVVANALKLPFADNSFSLVIMRDLLHHVNWDRDGVVSEAIRVLKPGGAVVIFEGSPAPVLSKLWMLLYSFERGMKNSSRKEMLELLKPYGTIDTLAVEKTMLVRAVFFVGCLLPDFCYDALVKCGRIWELLSSCVSFFVSSKKAAYNCYIVRPQ